MSGTKGMWGYAQIPGTVQLIRRLRKQGMTYAAIARHLNTAKIPTLAGLRGRRSVWRHDTVSAASKARVNLRRFKEANLHPEQPTPGSTWGSYFSCSGDFADFMRRAKEKADFASHGAMMTEALTRLAEDILQEKAPPRGPVNNNVNVATTRYAALAKRFGTTSAHVRSIEARLVHRNIAATDANIQRHVEKELTAAKADPIRDAEEAAARGE